MAKLHLHLPAEIEPCGYLANRAATTDYRVMTDVSPAELEWMLERGWRRFGHLYFRPVCAGCAECVSLRIPVATFRPSKSQRRARKRCANLRVEVRTPVADAERLGLYLVWHAMREESRGWKSSATDLEQYSRTFCVEHPCALEVDYYDGDRLVGVGFVDETPHALSSIYFFYHPDVRALGLGVASVLFEIEWARQCGHRYVYLGYRVRDCPSTNYKSQFEPHELMAARPEFDEPAQWLAPGSPLTGI
jgi:leucyl-tRNA---protein transferase